MFKGIVREYTSVANANIPFQVGLNTNDRTEYDSDTNTLKINKSGKYNVFGSFNINVGTASDVIIRLFENGNPVSTTYGEATASENNDVVNVSFVDVINVIPSDDNVANLSVRVASAGNVVTGTLIVEYVR